MKRNFRPMDDYDEEYGMDDFHNRNFSNEFISYPEHNRYNNAYGNYRGGYDRSNQGPPLGFGPIGPMGPMGPGPGGPMGPHGPHGPPGPPFPMGGDMRWRRGYPGPPSGNMFRGSKKDKIIKYLLRCGMPRDQVIHLPNDLLVMMQPMNCGLCATKFESSDLSRIHYASKNHLKNQKKWVNQRTNSGSNAREPLKSRDLYCELCDVHITSTGHAESHYAGKPHRAIVEGRKNPRNPFLLQPNKQGRLKALIRREVKFLKKIESTPEKKPKPEPKTGELYCEICKTSMMCSEQMTTHLNGKKHLSKEKQHILRLMKGEVSADDKKDTSKENTGEDANATAEEVDGDEEDEDDKDEEDEENEEVGGENGGTKETAQGADDDWGEGGEDWKPSSEDY